MFTAEERDRLLDSPLEFMDGIACQVQQGCYTPTTKGKPDKLTFDLMPDFMTAYKWIPFGDDIIMRRVPYYSLRKATGNDAVWFEAYLVEFAPGLSPTTTLGSKANLCFTANMNGCTFGIGSQAKPGDSVLVTHSNSRGMGSQEANTADQRTKASAIVGVGGRLFEPEHYRIGTKQSITFGYRMPGKLWKFGSLSYKMDGNRVMTYGAKKVTTNTVTG